MAKHRRYSRKRGQRRNRRASRKMRGGVDTPQNSDMSIDFETAIPPGTPGQNSPDISLNGISNISFQSNDTPLNIADLNGTVNSDEGNTSIESNLSANSQQQFVPDADISVIEDDNNGSIVGDLDEFDEPGFVFSDDEDDSGNTSMESSGGKRRKRRTSKRRTNKRKSKKTKKTRKHRKRRHYGGADTYTMTTQNNMSPYDNQNDKDTAVILAQKLR